MRTLLMFGHNVGGLAASMRPTRRLVPLALTALLIACGGGGGDGGSSSAVAGPPTTGATLTSSTNEAARAAESVVAGADAAVARSASLSGVSTVVGAPIAVHRTPASASAPDRKRALAVFPSPCTDWVDAPCAGSATVDSNLVNPTNTLNPGDYFDIRFAAVSGLLQGDSLLLNGRMRLDFETAFVVGAPTLAGLNVRLTLDSFSGAVNGRTFGPVTDLGRLQVDDQGRATLTSAGASYSGLSGVTTSGPGDYTVAGTTVRKAYWADAGRFVDVALANWRVASGRPADGAFANVAGAQGLMSVAVVSSTANTVVYTVVIATGSGTANYMVTATYPAGGGSPTYVAVPA